MTGSPPTDLAIFPNFVDENQPVGAPVGQFSVIDPDPDDLSFTYSFVEGSGDNDNRFFAIQGNQLTTNAALDYEAEGRSPAYSIVVRVTDQHDEFLDKRLTIFVENVNEAPTSLTLSASRIDENQPSGAGIGTLSATDPDKNDFFTYTLVPGPGGADNRLFTIGGVQLRTKAVLDFETQRTYNVLVRVTDRDGLWLDKPLSISVNDVNESPTAIDHSYVTLQNTQLAVTAPGVLQGAKDPEGARPTAVLVTGSGPEHGIVSLNPDGSFVYQPARNFVGSDAFEYQVFDGRFFSDAAIVSITVGYGPDPVLQAPSAVIGANKLALTRVQDNLLLIDFASRQVLFDRPLSDLNSITVEGTDKGTVLTIDPSVSVPGVLPGGVSFHGGSGHLADTLVLRGSAGADGFRVSEGSATVGSLAVGFSNVEQLVLAGGGGDDTYQISALPVNTTIPDGKGADWLDFSNALSGVSIDLGRISSQKVLADGGTLTIKGRIENVIGTGFSDRIKGNSANNVLVGGDGDDWLHGGAGRDLLIGGAGADTLRGGSGDDLLIAGTTAYDENTLALAAIMKEWASVRPFRKRCDGLALGLRPLVRDETVFDDAVRDDLFGGTGQDWFLDFLPDVAHDRGRSER